MDALPSLGYLDASSTAGGVQFAADAAILRKALDGQSEMMSTLLSSAQPQQGVRLDLSPAAQRLLV